MDELVGRVGVITGAASGIGLALARSFVARGMAVVCADIDARGLEQATASLVRESGNVVGVVTDVSDADAVTALRDETFSRFGTAHVVCNNAGMPAFQPMTASLDLANWRRTIDVNLFGVVHGVEAFLPRLLEQDEGHIVNTSSRQGLLGGASAGAYATSKFAIVGLSEVLDAELRDLGSRVGVSVLCPAPSPPISWVESPNRTCSCPVTWYSGSRDESNPRSSWPRCRSAASTSTRMRTPSTCSRIEVHGLSRTRSFWESCPDA